MGFTTDMSSILHLLNVNSDKRPIYAGKSRATAALSMAGLHEKLTAAGWHVSEVTALPVDSDQLKPSSRAPNGARNEASTVAACKAVQKAMTQSLRFNQMVLFSILLSGECLYMPAIMSALCDSVIDVRHGAFECPRVLIAADKSGGPQ